jgi:excisionase family DNA binding protein
MQDEEYLPIGKAAELLGLTPMTLRRWDMEGKLSATRTPGGHRLYSVKKLRIFLADSLFETALAWAASPDAGIPDAAFYCANSAIFQSRTSRLEAELQKYPRFAENYSLIVASVSEIGNNSFDHNLGNWPDVPGILFGYDLAHGQIVLADRGQGILKTLRRVKPSLSTDAAALQTAFTEVITGRAPEERGNGLKFVRKAVAVADIQLFFQSGTASVSLSKKQMLLDMQIAAPSVRGCLAFITLNS